MPPMKTVYGVNAAMTTGVDLLRGLAQMMGMAVLSIKGVTDGPDNDYAAQAQGALKALARYDLVVVHVEAPDEAAHAGDAAEKIRAIENIDREVIGRLRGYTGDRLRLLVMPDHPTPLELRTHCDDPVPFLLWGDGISGNGARRFTEADAARTDIFVPCGYNVMSLLTGKSQVRG
jgi:2,3-bisphosphoglycerate-independent phosphoglycerate mutase